MKPETWYEERDRLRMENRELRAENERLKTLFDDTQRREATFAEGYAQKKAEVDRLKKKIPQESDSLKKQEL